MASEETKNVLIVTLSNIGDVILTTPVISSLHAAFSSARFTVVVGPKAAGLLQGSRQIDRLLVYDKESPWSEKLKLVRALREEFYDWVIDLKNSAFPFLVRANRRSPIFRSHRARSARERHLEVLRMMKIRDPNTTVFDFFSPEDGTSLLEKLRAKGIPHLAEGIVVAPGAGSEPKRWPIEGFCEVLGRLLPVTTFPLFAVGDEGEVPLCERLSQIHPQRVVNLAGQITLRELAALVSRAKVVLTNDSACMHLAYELHRPVVAIFGPTDHERYGREDEIWRIVREPTLENLSSEKVFEACENLLNGRKI